MKDRFLHRAEPAFIESNILSDRSAVVLAWLLTVGIDKKSVSIREVARERGVSVGLVQRVFETLVFQGVLRTEGSRTAKRFIVSRPEQLLKDWVEQYSILRKCKMYSYSSGFPDREVLLRALIKSDLGSKTVLALHSAAQAHGCKNTNLDTLELYLLEPSIRQQIEQLLELEPQKRGYEVLLIEPYYKTLLKLEVSGQPPISPALLTFLDLYHFPLRGLEQALYMAEHIPQLKRIWK